MACGPRWKTEYDRQKVLEAAARNGTSPWAAHHLHRAMTSKAGEVARRASGAGELQRESFQNLAKQSQRASKYVIDPRKSRFSLVWDVVSVVVLVFTALVTPFEVAFINPFGEPVAEYPESNENGYVLGEQRPVPDVVDALFVLNRIVDCAFLFDFFLQFNLAYQDDESHLWVKNRRQIAIHYIKTWCLVDLGSQIPLWIDVARWTSDTENEDNNLLLLRLVRVLRLVKLLRLFRASRVVKRWERRLDISSYYGTLRLMKSLGFVLFYAHLQACLVMLLAAFSSNPVDSILGWYDFCHDETDWFQRANGTIPLSSLSRDYIRSQRAAHAPLEQSKFFCKKEDDLYLGLLSWSIMLSTGAGGSDMFPRVQARHERKGTRTGGSK
eukprot:699715-Prymnesium_polylepis.1